MGLKTYVEAMLYPAYSEYLTCNIKHLYIDFKTNIPDCCNQVPCRCIEMDSDYDQT